MQKSITILICSLSILVILMLHGCTLIGLSIGVKYDSLHPRKYITYTTSQAKLLKYGSMINIILKNNEQHSGKFIGISQIPIDEYDEKYSRCREQLSEKVLLPAIGETLIITDKRNKKTECTFIGFDSMMICLKIYRTSGLDIEKLSETNYIRFKHINSIIDDEGNTYDLNSIERSMAESKVPFVSAVVIHSYGTREIIPIDNIYQIQLGKTGAKGKIIGAFAGVTSDAIAVILIFLYLMDQAMGPSS